MSYIIKLNTSYRIFIIIVLFTSLIHPINIYLSIIIIVRYSWGIMLLYYIIKIIILLAQGS